MGGSASSVGLPPATRCRPSECSSFRWKTSSSNDRDREYARLLSFLGLDDNDATRDFFERQVRPEAAHAGRWREEVPPERLAAFEAHYERLVDDLRQRQRPYLPESRARAEATSA